MKRYISMICCFCFLTAAQAERSDTTFLTLEQCRTMALDQGTTARIQQEAKEVAELQKKAALAAMFPRLSANAAYTWTSHDITLLPNEADLGIGTAGVGADGSSWFVWNDKGLSEQTGQAIANLYQHFYDMLRIDNQHIVVGQVGITQPIYVGGRLHELYKMAQSAEHMVELRSESQHADIIVGVDEAYWRVLDVSQKRQLAHQYYNLLVKLEQDVTELQTEGLATQSDLLKVKAKLGEAEVKKMQADNGIILAQMALCQLIGLPLQTALRLDAQGMDDIPLSLTEDMSADVDHRHEIQLLQEAEKLAKSNTRLVAAGLQPNIVASANYIYTNPSALNGISSDWKNPGFFSVGVVVNIPIAHADDILRYKASKHEAAMAALKVEETRELLTLQVTQARQKMMEAQQKVVLADLNVRNCEQVLYSAQESYEAGMIAVSDLMAAQTAWMSAASDRVDALMEAQMCATYLKKYKNQL